MASDEDHISMAQEKPYVTQGSFVPTSLVLLWKETHLRVQRVTVAIILLSAVKSGQVYYRVTSDGLRLVYTVNFPNIMVDAKHVK